MRKIGIIAAMPKEINVIRQSLTGEKIESYAMYDFHIDKINGNTIISACCGVAKVNAAVCAQIMIERYGVDALISVGIAGGMSDKVGVFDIVISTETINHDTDILDLEQYLPYKGVYESDAKLIAEVAAICEKQGVKHVKGRIVSGEQFISDSKVKQDIADRLKPCAVDMESAAIGQCAYRNGVPFVSIRCISDNADDTMVYEEFAIIAADKIAGVIVAMVSEM